MTNRCRNPGFRTTSWKKRSASGQQWWLKHNSDLFELTMSFLIECVRLWKIVVVDVMERLDEGRDHVLLED
jgi:hypothetical protein